MYTVAINVSFANRTFATTVRDLARSTHWKPINDNQIRDTRELEVKPFTVLMVTDTETEAREFAGCIKAAYKAMDFEKEFVKVVDGLAV
jgi:hypothetical protein